MLADAASGSRSVTAQVVAFSDAAFAIIYCGNQSSTVTRDELDRPFPRAIANDTPANGAVRVNPRSKVLYRSRLADPRYRSRHRSVALDEPHYQTGRSSACVSIHASTAARRYRT
jgi:hypothetical protein